MKKKLFIFLFVCVCMLMFSSKAFAMSEIGDNGVKLDNLFDANEKEVRRSSYLIKDIGKMKNPYDTVDLGMLYNGIFDISSLKKFGYWNDDWENTNLKIQVAASKELRKTTNVWQLYKNNGGYTYTKLTSAE